MLRLLGYVLHFARPLHPLVKQRFQADGVAGPRLERLSILAEHGAEGDMDEFHAVDPLPVTAAPELCRREQLFEVGALPAVDHVEDAVGLPVFHPPLERCQVGRGIEKRAVGLADQERRRVVAVQEDADRAAALPGPHGRVGHQLRDHPRQHGLIKTLAEGVVERDVQPREDAVDLGSAERHELLPERPVLGVAFVQLRRLGEHLPPSIGIPGREGSRLGIAGEFLRLGVGNLAHQPVEPA